MSHLSLSSQHQRSDSVQPASQPSPVMQVQEDGDNLIPFAKEQASIIISLQAWRCSRVVSRSSPPRLPAQSLRLTPQPYGDTFWDNLSQRPSSSWMEEQCGPSLPRATGPSQPGAYAPEGLPPPEMLFRRKRRRSYLAGMRGSRGVPARVRAVTYHLEDLRRRQRIISELKQAQWGSPGAAAGPPAPAEASAGCPGPSGRPDLEEEGAAHPQEEDHVLPPGRAQLLWSPWSPLVQEGSFLSGQLSSLPPCSAFRASRDPLSNTWGMELPEE